MRYDCGDKIERPPGDCVNSRRSQGPHHHNHAKDCVMATADSTTTVKNRLPHSCGGCNNRWGGARTAHCAACHQTFSTPGNFDLHRAGSKDRTFIAGECSDPAARGLVLSDRGVWTAPGRDEDAAE